MSRFGIGIFAASALAIAALVACADAEEAAEPGHDVPEGGTLPYVDGGGTSTGDAGADGSGDASTDADAAPRECSKEGFCHTEVPPKQSLRGVWTDGTGVAWAISEEGGILRFDGKAWKVHATVKGPLLSIWGSGPTDLWIGGETGLWHGQGASSAALVFTEVTTPDPQTPITSIWGTSATDVYAVGGRIDFPLVGRVLHYAGPTDAGKGSDWTLETVTKDAILYERVFGSPQSGVWLAGRFMNPEQFWFDVTVLRRPVGAKDFVVMPLPGDPDVMDKAVGMVERMYDASMGADGLSAFVIGKTHSGTPAYLTASSTNAGQTFAWKFAYDGVFGEPESHAIGGGSASDVWIVGDYGRLEHLSGGKWKQSLISVSKFPLIDPFYAIGGKGNDMWFVGDGVALHRDPSKAQP